MYYELRDYEGEYSLGIVKVTNVEDCEKNSIDAEEEITESWEDFNKLGEHKSDPQDVPEFVKWHNKNWFTQLERIFVTIIQVV